MSEEKIEISKESADKLISVLFKLHGTNFRLASAIGNIHQLLRMLHSVDIITSHDVRNLDATIKDAKSGMNLLAEFSNEIGIPVRTPELKDNEQSPGKNNE